MNITDYPSPYYSFDVCYNLYIKACQNNDMEEIKKYIKSMTRAKNNTSMNFICIALAKNKLVELNATKQQETIDRHEKDIEMLKKEIEILKKLI